VLARLPLCALVVAAILVPTQARAAEPFAPLVASATLAPEAQVLVAWVPGESMADSFSVYGISPSGSLTLLRSGITDLSVMVPMGFTSYAVSGVRNGVESAPVVALGSQCELIIYWSPPNAGLVCPETRKAVFVPDVRSPTWL